MTAFFTDAFNDLPPEEQEAYHLAEGPHST
jgi:hypothetical protein